MLSNKREPLTSENVEYFPFAWDGKHFHCVYGVYTKAVADAVNGLENQYGRIMAADGLDAAQAYLRDISGRCVMTLSEKDKLKMRQLMAQKMYRKNPHYFTAALQIALKKGVAVCETKPDKKLFRGYDENVAALIARLPKLDPRKAV